MRRWRGFSDAFRDLGARGFVWLALTRAARVEHAARAARTGGRDRRFGRIAAALERALATPESLPDYTLVGDHHYVMIEPGIAKPSLPPPFVAMTKAELEAEADRTNAKVGFVHIFAVEAHGGDASITIGGTSRCQRRIASTSSAVARARTTTPVRTARGFTRRPACRSAADAQHYARGPDCEPSCS